MTVQLHVDEVANRLPLLRVAFCGENYGDYDLLRKLESSGLSHSWPLVTTAEVGDRVVFYNVDRDRAFVATGKVTSMEGGAHVGRIQMLSLPVPRATVLALLPMRGWLKFTRNATTVPFEFAGRLWPLLRPKHEVAGVETGSKASTMFGAKRYHERARRALPILVGVAQRGATIYYEDLAELIGISNPRLLNYILGSIGQTLLVLGKRRQERLPPIQCLVVNKADELPGEGFAYFVTEQEYRAMSKPARRKAVAKIHKAVWNYPAWEAVLEELFLEPPSDGIKKKIKKCARPYGSGYGDPERNRIVEKAAIKFVRQKLRRDHYTVKSRETDGIGYDLDAFRGADTIHIEVKGISGNLVNFQITRGEVNRARVDPCFELWAVTNATTRSSKLHRFTAKEFLDEFTLEPTAYRATGL